jgi:hypothetical protein
MSNGNLYKPTTSKIMNIYASMQHLGKMFMQVYGNQLVNMYASLY